ncbi:hypothetical protein NC651_025118 [Populus alba x Populus x berolinensis]|nr:hypothetical protein NC651_025118 [Populus alba x Populus x berolinensis]
MSLQVLDNLVISSNLEPLLGMTAAPLTPLRVSLPQKAQFYRDLELFTQVVAKLEHDSNWDIY